MKGEEARYQNTRSILFAAVEVGVFTAIFAVAGAWPAPDVNEGYCIIWQKLVTRSIRNGVGMIFFLIQERRTDSSSISLVLSRRPLRFLQRLGSGDGRAGWY